MNSDLFNNLGYGVGAALAYAGVGLVLLALGFFVLDKLTPGKLAHLIYVDNNVNAARMAMAHLAAVALVITSAAFSAQGETYYIALADMAVFGLVGIIMQAVAFKAVDALTPGELGEIVTAPTPCPAATVSAVISIVIAVVVSIAVF